MAGASSLALCLRPGGLAGGRARARGRRHRRRGVWIAGGPTRNSPALGIRGPVIIRGDERPGKRVDAVFVEPVVGAPSGPQAGTALDGPGHKRPIARAGSSRYRWRRDGSQAGRGAVRSRAGKGADLSRHRGLPGRGFAARSTRRADSPPGSGRDHGVERHRLRLQGHNRALRRLGASFSTRGARMRRPPFAVRASSAGIAMSKGGARVAGRAVIDSMRLARGSGARDTRISASRLSPARCSARGNGIRPGGGKIEELELLRVSDPDAFCAYCLRDSELVLRILSETGLDDLTARRAALTGVSLELAWTSIPAFERVYGPSFAPAGSRYRPKPTGAYPGPQEARCSRRPLACSPASLVFDFRSLYPSIMRTSTWILSPMRGRGQDDRLRERLVAPNGARFDRSKESCPAS